VDNIPAVRRRRDQCQSAGDQRSVGSVWFGRDPFNSRTVYRTWSRTEPPARDADSGLNAAVSFAALKQIEDLMVRRQLLLALLLMLVTGLSAAQPHAPVVTMSVTLPDGRTQELTAPESGLATLQLKDGSESGFRPTIQDSSPWNRIVVTIFRTATTSAPTTVVGEVEVKRGRPVVESKTNPSFKVSVPKVSPPATSRRKHRRPDSLVLLSGRRDRQDVRW
jgi:hypothetical protein